MSKVTIIRGLPGSGKTTLARTLAAQRPNTVRINKDDLRSMLHDGRYSPDNELVGRTPGDRRPAAEFKRSHLEAILEAKNIDLVIDDDVTVIHVAQGLGLKTMQPNHLGRSIC